MTESAENTDPRWQKTATANIVRHVQSENEYAIIRLRGKLIWKSRKNDRISVAKSLLNDFHKQERKWAERVVLNLHCWSGERGEKQGVLQQSDVIKSPYATQTAYC